MTLSWNFPIFLLPATKFWSPASLGMSSTAKERESQAHYPWQLICLITVAFSAFTHQKPQFPQIFGFVAITKAVKMLSHLSFCILRALIRQEKKKDIWIKHFPHPHLQIRVYNYLFLYRYNMHIFMLFYHPGSWMESEKQNSCASASSAECFRYLTLPKSSSWLSLLSAWVLLSQLLVHIKHLPCKFCWLWGQRFPSPRTFKLISEFKCREKRMQRTSLLWRVWFVQRCQILHGEGEKSSPLNSLCQNIPNFTHCCFLGELFHGCVGNAGRSGSVFCPQSKTLPRFPALYHFPLGILFTSLGQSQRFSPCPSRVASPELLVFMSVNRFPKLPSQNI